MIESIEKLKSEVARAANQEEAIAVISSYIELHPDCDEAFTMRGMKYWGAGKRSLALNDYLTAIKINPESRARFALEASREILDYRNKDLYNP